MNTARTLNLLMSATMGLAFAVSAQTSTISSDEKPNLVPTGKGVGMFDANAPLRAPAEDDLLDAPGVNPALSLGYALPQYGIQYHGGPVMGIGSPVNVYYIWYGNWPNSDTARTILQNLATKIGGSPRFNINTTYTNAAGTKISNSVVFKKAVNSTYGYVANKVLNDAGVKNIVSNAISTAKLPADSNGVYFVLTSKDVRESSGFCSQYCGWHYRDTIAAKTIKYSFIGDPSSQCPNSCSVQTVTSPNNNPAADAMASVIVHELDEATTDPQLNAWYDVNGFENADKCAWTFGTTSTAPNGSQYNTVLGTRKYLIQQNWVNVAPSGKCAKTYP